MLAHDLRNPLSGILFASQFLIEDAASVLDSQQMRLLRSIESSSILLMRLIGDTLEPPRAGSRKPKLQAQRVDVAWLMEQIAAILQRIVRGNNVRLEVTNDESAACMLLDPLKMPQALTVVLTHAIHCSPPAGDIEVDIKPHHQKVVITVYFSGSGSGTGSGQPDQELDSRAISPARRIVEAHGGRVTEEHAAGRSSFVLTLPRVRQNDAEPSDSSEPPSTGFRNGSQNDQL
jgi:K+-sensing histidine kinase KdpD